MSRAQRSLVVLTAVTVLSVGLLAQALSSPGGIGADVLTATSLLLLIFSATLLVRVLRFLTRPVRRPDAAARRRVSRAR